MNEDTNGAVVSVGDTVTYTGIVEEIIDYGGLSTLSIKSENVPVGPGAVGRDHALIPTVSTVKLIPQA